MPGTVTGIPIAASAPYSSRVNSRLPPDSLSKISILTTTPEADLKVTIHSAVSSARAAGGAALLSSSGFIFLLRLQRNHQGFERTREEVGRIRKARLPAAVLRA